MFSYSGLRESGAGPRRLPHQRLSVQSGRLRPHRPLGAEDASLPHQEDGGSVRRDLHPGPVQPGGRGLRLHTGPGSLLRGRQGGSEPADRSSDPPAGEQDAAAQLPGDGLLHRRRPGVRSPGPVSEQVRPLNATLNGLTSEKT